MQMKSLRKRLKTNAQCHTVLHVSFINEPFSQNRHFVLLQSGFDSMDLSYQQSHEN